MTRRILVTGANGFVGPHLVALVHELESDVAITGWHRPDTSPADASDRPSAAAPVVAWQGVDLLDRRAVGARLDLLAPDEVYHLAGAAHVGQAWRNAAATLDVNVLGTDHLLGALRELRLDARVLVAGSATIYAASESALDEDSPLAPSNPYALSKLAQEMLGRRAAEDDGQHVLLVRAFNHVGPGQDAAFFAPAFARQLAAIERQLAPPVLRVGNLEPRRDLTDVRDTVRAYHVLMKRGVPGRPYNVCSGRGWRIREVLETLVARCRVEVAIEIDPDRLRPNDAPVILGSYARLHAETGWTPSIPFDQTLADLLDDARVRLAAEMTSPLAMNGGLQTT